MINWKLRFKNKVTLTAIVLQVIAIVYTVLSICGITPNVAENTVIGVAESAIGLLVLMGVVTDPTTAGVHDSEQAMGYESPKE